MSIVRVPKPSSDSLDLNRPVSSLLKTQILHLQEAEFRLPAGFQTNIYIHTIRTEAEAGEYIRQVTEALHEAHASRSLRARTQRKPERGIAIAAAADTGKKKSKKSTAKKGKQTGKTKGKPKAKN